MTVMAVVCRL